MRLITTDTIEKDIEQAVQSLLILAGDLTKNKFSENHQFIVTEIKDTQLNFRQQRVLNKRLNDKKTTLSFAQLMPVVQELYPDFYDINLVIYRATQKMTTIDFRYYPKSSLDQDYRETITHNPPMLHAKVVIPPWLDGKKKKFNINWQHHELLTRYKFFGLRLKLLLGNPARWT